MPGAPVTRREPGGPAVCAAVFAVVFFDAVDAVKLEDAPDPMKGIRAEKVGPAPHDGDSSCRAVKPR